MRDGFGLKVNLAKSPSHKFGQDLGNLLEDVVLYEILKPRLEKFVKSKKYYLDCKGKRSARKGAKVTWLDKYGNQHDLDFVIEIGGTDDMIGRPIAFIEAAWRRYTKHSKNKAQEIQGALLPIIELHRLSAPFYGVVLAGEFTEPALTQLRNNNFAVIYIPYSDVISAFKVVDFDIAFDEATPDAIFKSVNKKLKSLTKDERGAIRQKLTQLSKKETDNFMEKLRAALERCVKRIVLLPLFGKQYEFNSVDDALVKIDSFDLGNPDGDFNKFEVIVEYCNGDRIEAKFHDKIALSEFLSKL